MSFTPTAGAEAQVGHGSVGQPAAELFQQPAFVVVGQFLQQHGVADHHFQDAAAQGGDARLGGVVGAGRLGPGFFQVQAALTTAPAAGREQPAEDLAEVLGAAAGRCRGEWP